MEILPTPVAFVWDKGNLLKNLKKHNVTVQEAEELFVNEPFIIASDVSHSTIQEKRYRGLGETKTNRCLFVAFTVRERNIRIISVRDMSRKEKAVYEKLKTPT